MLTWLKKRLSERTTYIGIIALAGLCGYQISPELQEQILTAVTAIIAVIFTVTADKETSNVKPETKDQPRPAPEYPETGGG